MTTVEDRLAATGLRLPPLRRPSGMYRGWTRAGDLVFLAGQGAEGHVGRVGADLDLEAARAAARDCMLNLLAQTRDALGSLDAVRTVLKVLGFVACTDGFTQLPQVLDGASEVLHTAYGADVGGHARSTIGVQALPLGFAVEIEMVVQAKEPE